MAVGLRKVVDERTSLSKSKGGGVLRLEAWANERGHVVRYNLAYVNHLMYAGDNGRVLGFDSAHGFHHRHYKGKVEAVSFDTYKRVEARFKKEWSILVKEAKHAED
jgi:hypothetical protein